MYNTLALLRTLQNDGRQTFSLFKIIFYTGVSIVAKLDLFLVRKTGKHSNQGIWGKLTPIFLELQIVYMKARNKGSMKNKQQLLCYLEQQNWWFYRCLHIFSKLCNAHCEHIEVSMDYLIGIMAILQSYLCKLTPQWISLQRCKYDMNEMNEHT